jgi:hypothetical protein
MENEVLGRLTVFLYEAPDSVTVILDIGGAEILAYIFTFLRPEKKDLGRIPQASSGGLPLVGRWKIGDAIDKAIPSIFSYGLYIPPRQYEPNPTGSTLPPCSSRIPH